MKNKLSLAIALVVAASLVIIPALAKGPTNIDWMPWNDQAWWNSGQYIGAERFGIGTPTTIVEDGVTISVSAIPMANNPEADEWEGTWLMWKASHAWLENPYQEGAWMTYKFWLNGAGPVTISYDDGTPTEIVTEFIFFKVLYVGPGMGNSDFDASNSFDVIIQAYQ